MNWQLTRDFSANGDFLLIPSKKYEKKNSKHFNTRHYRHPKYKSCMYIIMGLQVDNLPTLFPHHSLCLMSKFLFVFLEFFSFHLSLCLSKRYGKLQQERKAKLPASLKNMKPEIMAVNILKDERERLWMIELILHFLRIF